MTLFELLLYMAIASILIVLLGKIGIQVLHDRAALRDAQDTVYSGEQAMAHIVRAIETAVAVTAPAVGNSSTTLALRVADTERDPIVYTLRDGRVYESIGQGEAIPLSTEGTNVTSLMFTHVDTGTAPDAVAIALELSPRRSDIAGTSFGTLSLTSVAFNHFAP